MWQDIQLDSSHFFRTYRTKLFPKCQWINSLKTYTCKLQKTYLFSRLQAKQPCQTIPRKTKAALGTCPNSKDNCWVSSATYIVLKTNQLTVPAVNLSYFCDLDKLKKHFQYFDEFQKPNFTLWLPKFYRTHLKHLIRSHFYKIN